MGQKILVERHLDDGERLLKQLQQDGYPYSAAAWFHEGDREKWYFYLVTSLVDAEGKFGAYARLNESCGKLADLSIEPLDLRVFSPDSPEGIGLKPYIGNVGHAPLRTHFRSIDFNRGLSGDAYVYPRLLQSAALEWAKDETAGATVEKLPSHAVPIYQPST